ncbi:MAG: hypothetical protein ABL894_14555, partial [Hyphomicrobium sp.]
MQDDAEDGVQQGGLFEASAPLYAGHRQRLRERFRKGGADAMPDYELLELVLFRAIPRRDTKDLAKRLIARFGSFAEVVNAPEPRLREVSDAGDAVITELKLVQAAALRLMKGGLFDKPILSSWQNVLDYLKAVQGFEAREQALRTSDQGIEFRRHQQSVGGPRVRALSASPAGRPHRPAPL